MRYLQSENIAIAIWYSWLGTTWLSKRYAIYSSNGHKKLILKYIYLSNNAIRLIYFLSLCWYWWNYWPSLVRFSFHISNFHQYMIHFLSSNEMVIIIWYIFLNDIAVRTWYINLVANNIAISTRFTFLTSNDMAMALASINMAIRIWSIYLSDNDNAIL